MTNFRQVGPGGKRCMVRKFKKICKLCRQRQARCVRRIALRKKGVTRLGRRAFVKTARGHDLCSQCYRSLIESLRAKQLQEAGREE